MMRTRARTAAHAAPVTAPITVMVAATILAAVLAAPLAVGSDEGAFPLSTYPMFARDRGRVVSIATVVATGADGTHRLSPRLIGGSDEPMLAADAVATAVRRGDAGALCEEVAARVRRAGSDPAGAQLEVVTERYDTLEWFDGSRTPLDRRVHATCTVGA